MKVFKAKKGVGIYLFLLIALLFQLWLVYAQWDLIKSVFSKQPFSAELLLLLLGSLPFIVLLWAYLNTNYWIDSQVLYYKSAFLSGKIPIETIKRIKQNTTLWSGNKPALAKNGLIIQYGYDEIYIAPEEPEQLIKELLKINPKISIE